MKYTPGPWNVAGDFVLADEDQMMVCEIRGWGYLEARFGVDKAPGVQNANAHLIAAAPDLLEALKTALEHIHGLHSVAVEQFDYQMDAMDDGDVYHKSIVEKVEKAIAKAEGVE